tara:strand:- start:364 stop:639 length:276 start_codon:yes stop_codon:yes gene_type:complete
MADQRASIHTQDRLTKQLNATMATVGELDRRLGELEQLVLGALNKTQSDIVALHSELSSFREKISITEKFDMVTPVSEGPTELLTGNSQPT